MNLPLKMSFKHAFKKPEFFCICSRLLKKKLSENLIFSEMKN